MKYGLDDTIFVLNILIYEEKNNLKLKYVTMLIMVFSEKWDLFIIFIFFCSPEFSTFPPLI